MGIVSFMTCRKFTGLNQCHVRRPTLSSLLVTNLPPCFSLVIGWLCLKIKSVDFLFFFFIIFALMEKGGVTVVLAFYICRIY